MMSENTELDALTQMVADLYPYAERFPTFRSIPENGRSREEILELLSEMRTEEDAMGDAGRVSGSIYHGGHDHYKFLVEAFKNFAHSNVLQRDMYPSATKFEGEIVAMTASMLHGDGEVCGVITSGGTESLINPLLAYRERALEKGITEPEVIIPITAHVALEKGAHYFGIKVLLAPLGLDWKVDLEWVRSHVNKNTIALVGSAGNYPHGVIDDIEGLSQYLQIPINLVSRLKEPRFCSIAMRNYDAFSTPSFPIGQAGYMPRPECPGLALVGLSPLRGQPW
jgi:sphinganine-1-phosphate aldolase